MPKPSIEEIMKEQNEAKTQVFKTAEVFLDALTDLVKVGRNAIMKGK